MKKAFSCLIAFAACCLLSGCCCWLFDGQNNGEFALPLNAETKKTVATFKVKASVFRHYEENVNLPGEICNFFLAKPALVSKSLNSFNYKTFEIEEISENISSIKDHRGSKGQMEGLFADPHNRLIFVELDAKLPMGMSLPVKILMHLSQDHPPQAPTAFKLDVWLKIDSFAEPVLKALIPLTGNLLDEKLSFILSGSKNIAQIINSQQETYIATMKLNGIDKKVLDDLETLLKKYDSAKLHQSP